MCVHFKITFNQKLVMWPTLHYAIDHSTMDQIFLLTVYASFSIYFYSLKNLSSNENIYAYI